MHVVSCNAYAHNEKLIPEFRYKKFYKSFKHKTTKNFPHIRRIFPETWIWPIENMNSG